MKANFYFSLGFDLLKHLKMIKKSFNLMIIFYQEIMKTIYLKKSHQTLISSRNQVQNFQKEGKFLSIHLLGKANGICVTPLVKKPSLMKQISVILRNRKPNKV